MAPEKKKQVESVVMYRVSGADMTPEKKKQAESAVRYRVVGADMAPEITSKRFTTEGLTRECLAFIIRR